MVQGIAARRKRYVEVEATFLEDGRIVPRAVIWHDGRRFPVRAVLGVRRCASLKVGGEGVRYDGGVAGADASLSREEPGGWGGEIVCGPLDPLLDGGACAWGAD